MLSAYSVNENSILLGKMTKIAKKRPKIPKSVKEIKSLNLDFRKQRVLNIN